MNSLMQHHDVKRVLSPVNLVLVLMIVGLLTSLIAGQHTPAWRGGEGALMLAAAILAYLRRAEAAAWLACTLMSIFFLLHALS